MIQNLRFPALILALGSLLALEAGCDEAMEVATDLVEQVPMASVEKVSNPALIAFSANLQTGIELHRDSKDGADLFVGTLDLDSGAVTDVRMVAGGQGAQWFPDLSPDGDYLAYNDTVGRTNRVVVVNLVTMDKVVVAENGRFPAFAPDSRTLFYSSSPAGALHTYDLRTGVVGELTHASPLEDPFPVGATHVAAHTSKDGGMALPVVVDLATGKEQVFDAKRFGHLTATPSGDRILAGEATSSQLFYAESRGGGGWSEFTPLVSDLGASIAALDSSFSRDGQILLSYPSWPTDDLLVVSAQGTKAGTQRKRLSTTIAKLFMVDLSGGKTRLRAIKLADYGGASFEIHSLCSDVVAGLDASRVGGQAFVLGAAAHQGTAPAASRGGSLVYVVTTARNKDPDNPKAADYQADKAAFTKHRNGVIAMAKALDAAGIAWNWQPDWNFLEGVVKHEVQGKDSSLLAQTEGLNIVRWLVKLGVEINPHSHESGGYNYADVAYLIEKSGAEAAPVVGGHIWDHAEAGYSDWPRWSGGLTGSKYSKASWQPVLLAGGSTMGHQGEEIYTGVWRPTERAFYTHDPNGSMVAIGNMSASPQVLFPFLEQIQAGGVPAGMYTASFNLEAYEAEKGDYVDGAMADLVAGLVKYRDSGQIQFVQCSDIPRIWAELYGSQASIHGPVSARGGGGGQQQAGRPERGNRPQREGQGGRPPRGKGGRR